MTVFVCLPIYVSDCESVGLSVGLWAILLMLIKFEQDWQLIVSVCKRLQVAR